MNHDLRETYLNRLRSFERPNPAGYRFLRRLEEEGPAHGLWMSAVTGVHLYKTHLENHGFLVHIQLSTSKSKPFSLVFAKHDQIWTQSYDASHLVLPHPLVRLVMESSGFRTGWAAAPAGSVELKSTAPAAFYEILFRWLQALPGYEEQSAAV